MRCRLLTVRLPERSAASDQLFVAASFVASKTCAALKTLAWECGINFDKGACLPASPSTISKRPPTPLIPSLTPLWMRTCEDANASANGRAIICDGWCRQNLRRRNDTLPTKTDKGEVSREPTEQEQLIAAATATFSANFVSGSGKSGEGERWQNAASSASRHRRFVGNHFVQLAIGCFGVQKFE